MDSVTRTGDTATRLGQGRAGLGVPLLQDAQTLRHVGAGSRFPLGTEQMGTCLGLAAPQGSRVTCSPVSATCLGNRTFSMKSNKLLSSSPGGKVRLFSYNT